MSKDKSKPSNDPGKSGLGRSANGSLRERLTKSNKDRVLAGVCGGLGQHSDLPSWLWRIIFLSGVVLVGAGAVARPVLLIGVPVLLLTILAYLGLWIALPSDRVNPRPQVPPLFRRIDWISFGVTAVCVLIGYILTLAPDLGLEDSGELATGSFYAGVPHPPGYPVWTIFTWLFTVLIPFSNIAWRVALASAVSGALSCGLIALITSRGGSMILEGIEEFKGLEKKWENALCMVSGFVAGMLIGFNGFMWSQAVIVEVYAFSMLSFLGVLCCLLRWAYAPSQRRYLYWALFLFGICFTNHQTLIVAAMGIEVAIAAASPRLGRDLFLLNSLIFLGGLAAGIPSYEQNPAVFVIFVVIGVLSIAAYVWMAKQTSQVISNEIFCGVLLGLFWLLGAAFYLYMPLASSTNPPMNWGYPRTWEGFLHALTRGQYEKTNPTGNIGRFFDQLNMLLSGAVDEFNLAYLLIGLIPFFFFSRMQKRERGWLLGVVGMYLGLAVLLIILLNPSSDRQSREMSRVFFTASHVMISLCIGYGLTLFGAMMATQYPRFRLLGWAGGAVAVAVALYVVTVVFQSDKEALSNLPHFFGLESSFDPYVRLAALFGLGLAVVATATFLVARSRPPMAMLIALFALMPVKSIISHWSDNEQRGHLFGYWFGHDMFTPPFTAPDGKLSYDAKLRAAAMKSPEAALVYPEMARDAILFGGTDPGRFCPTYMIFCESFIPERCKPRDPAFNRRDVNIITQNALADQTYLEYIRAHYNRSTQVDTPFFQEMLRTRTDVARRTTNLVARLAYQWLDEPLARFGRNFERRRREEGVYPMKEIHTPGWDDHQQAFNEYMADAGRRMQSNQLRPGEDVKLDSASGRMAVSGQVAVMAINGLLTKVIFDKNPTNEFYVEESFPLDWMYDYLEPYGVIMKINRQPLAEIGDDVAKRDHEFWSKYSDRLIGNWITYDTPVKEICDFAVRVYEHRDYTGFKGDRKFVRDDQAQKSFSKLRSSIGGVYSWRLARAKTPAEHQRMLKEADFAFRQAFAFCPYSPEAVFRYTTLLASAGRFDDAQLIAETCLRFDRDNPNIQNWVNQIKAFKQQQGQATQLQQKLGQLEEQLRTNPGNAKVAFEVASAYLQIQNTNAAFEILDRLASNPGVDAGTLLSVANAYVQLQQGVRLESVLKRLVTVTPESPEAWFDLASTQVQLGRDGDAMQSLRKGIELNDERLRKQPNAPNLRHNAATNPALSAIRSLPEFQKLLAPP